MATATASVTHVATIIIPVADQRAAVAFYGDTLGFELRREAPLPGGETWIEVGPPEGQTTLALMPARNGHTPADIGLASSDVDAAHAHLVEAGVDVDAEVLRLGEGVPPMFTFRDPDGNQFRIVQTAG